MMMRRQGIWEVVLLFMDIVQVGAWKRSMFTPGEFSHLHTKFRFSPAKYHTKDRNSRDYKNDFAASTAVGVSLKGKMALVKQGGPFQGTKVKNPEANGMAGVILFLGLGDNRLQDAKGQTAYPRKHSAHGRNRA